MEGNFAAWTPVLRRKAQALYKDSAIYRGIQRSSKKDGPK